MSCYLSCYHQKNKQKQNQKKPKPCTLKSQVRIMRRALQAGTVPALTEGSRAQASPGLQGRSAHGRKRHVDHMAPQQLFKGLAVSSLTKRPDVVLIYYQSGGFSFPYSFFFFSGLSLSEHLICLVAVIMLWSHLAKGTIWKASRECIMVP